MAAIEFEKRGHIGIISLNNPPLNITNHEIFNGIREAFEAVDAMEDVYVVILRSAVKKAFCTGNDINEFLELTDAEKIFAHDEIVSGAAMAVYNCRKPVIAAVNGYTVGGGIVLAACCDILVVSDEARFWMSEVKIGSLGGTEFLQLLLPGKLARYYAMTGKQFTAGQLYGWGGAVEIVPYERLMDTAVRIAEELMENAPLAISLYKQVMNKNDDSRLKEKFHREREHMVILKKTEDAAEASRAFLEKRKPVYKNK